MKIYEKIDKILWETKNKLDRLHYLRGETRKGINIKQVRRLHRTKHFLTLMMLDRAEGMYEQEKKGDGG